MRDFDFKRVGRLIYANQFINYKTNRKSVIVGFAVLAMLFMVTGLRYIGEAGSYVYFWESGSYNTTILILTLYITAQSFCSFKSKSQVNSNYLLPASIPEKYVAAVVSATILTPLLAFAMLFVLALFLKLMYGLLYGLELDIISGAISSSSFKISNILWVSVLLSTALFCSVTYKKPFRMTLLFFAVYVIAILAVTFVLLAIGTMDLFGDSLSNLQQSGSSSYSITIEEDDFGNMFKSTFIGAKLQNLIYALLSLAMIVGSYFNFKRGQLS